MRPMGNSHSGLGRSDHHTRATGQKVHQMPSLATLLSVELEQRCPGLTTEEGVFQQLERLLLLECGAGVPWKVLAQEGDGVQKQTSAKPGRTAHKARAERVRDNQGLGHCEGEPLRKEPGWGTAMSSPLGPRACLEVPGSPSWLEVMEPRLSPELSFGGAPDFSGQRPGELKAGLGPLAVCAAGTVAAPLGPQGADRTKANLNL